MALADLPLDMLDAGLEHVFNWPFEDDEEAQRFKAYFDKYLLEYWCNGAFPPRVWNCWAREGEKYFLFLLCNPEPFLIIGERTNNKQEAGNCKLGKEIECHPEPHKAVKQIVKNLKKSELDKLRKADLQISKKKRTYFTRLSEQRLRLKKELKKRGSLEERIKYMPKFLTAVATNIIPSRSKVSSETTKTRPTTTRSDQENGGDSLDGSLTRELSGVSQTEDPYAHMVIGGKRKEKQQEESERRGNKICRECAIGFNSKSKKVQCRACDHFVHKIHLKVDDDPENYECTSCKPRKRVPKAPKERKQAVANFGCKFCDFVSCHRYSFKRHLKRIHKKTDVEAEELARDEEEERVAPNEDDQEADVGGHHDLGAGAGQHHAQDADVGQEYNGEDMTQHGSDESENKIKHILEKLKLENLLATFEEELITMEILKKCTAMELRGILKIPFGSAKLILDEVSRSNEPTQNQENPMNQQRLMRPPGPSRTLTRAAWQLPEDYPITNIAPTFNCVKCNDRFIAKESLDEHMKEEHGKREPRCIICNQTDLEFVKKFTRPNLRAKGFYTLKRANRDYFCQQ